MKKGNIMWTQIESEKDMSHLSWLLLVRQVLWEEEMEKMNKKLLCWLD